MKRILLLVLVSICMLNAQTDPELKWLHPGPQGWDILWMKMWDNNNWYMAGQYGVFMKTTDAGQTWKINNRAGWQNTAYPGALTNWDANAAWFFDQNNGFICSRNSAGVLKTTDGGETFQEVIILPGSPGGKHLYNIYFVNSTLGFICGNSQYKIFKTTDGGNSWEQLPNLDEVAYRDVFATNAMNITACSEGGKVYKTTDGGSSWNIIQLPTLQPLYDLEFVNDTLGYVSGGVGFFKSTTDGGFTWTGGTNPPTSYTNWKIKAVNNDVYVAGDYTKLFKSTNGGSSWDTLALPTSLFSGFSFGMDVYGSNIVVAGRYGNIYKSTNGGSNFTSLSERFSDWGAASSLYVNNTTGKIIACGRWSDFPGCIVYSSDWGSTWQSSPFVSGFQLLNRLQMFDDNNGYIIGDGPYIGKTTDGGLTLTNLNIPFGAGKSLVEVDFLNPSTGWVVGGSSGPGTSLIAKTTDGGITWIDQSLPLLSSRIKGIDIVDANTGYISHFTVHKTTNGGTSWSPLTLPNASFIESVTAFDLNNVYAAGAATGSVCGFWKTSDGGANWIQVPVPSGIGTTIFDQEWLDMNNGILVGVLGLILKTTDAGLNWTVMNTGGWSVYDAEMISADDFYISAGNSQVFRYHHSTSPATFPLTVNVTSGWNMVSIPGLLPTNQNVTSWWPGKDPAAGVFKFQGGYQSVTTAEPGTGYWMKNLETQTYNTGDEWPAGGIQIVSHDPIPGQQGWNLIGGYEQTISTAALTTTPPGLITGSVYKYSGGYVPAATMDPGYGYWVKLTGGGTINIPSSPAGPLKSSTALSTEGFGKITITDKTGRSYLLYSTDNNNIDLNQYELPPAPPQGMFDVRFASQRFSENLNSAKGIEMTGVQYPVNIKAEGTGIILTDETGKEIAKLKSGEEVSINYTGKLYISENVIPMEFSLAQNYPNPFNPSTIIEFSLAENVTNAKLSVYNALGEKVTELVNTSLSAGKYTYQWDANEFATGMYIYELKADKFVSIKKMILIK